MAGMGDLIIGAIMLLLYALPIVSVIWAARKWLQNRKARREYLENHPRYLHSGGNRRPS